MLDTTSQAEPSDLVKASPSLMAIWTSGHLPPQEIERRALGAQRLKEVLASIPWHVRKAERNPDYWNVLYASRVNW